MYLGRHMLFPQVISSSSANIVKNSLPFASRTSFSSTLKSGESNAINYVNTNNKIENLKRIKRKMIRLRQNQYNGVGDGGGAGPSTLSSSSPARLMDNGKFRSKKHDRSEQKQIIKNNMNNNNKSNHNHNVKYRSSQQQQNHDNANSKSSIIINRTSPLKEIQQGTQVNVKKLFDSLNVDSHDFKHHTKDFSQHNQNKNNNHHSLIVDNKNDSKSLKTSTGPIAINGNANDQNDEMMKNLFAGSKSYVTPSPSDLPKPPQNWMILLNAININSNDGTIINNDNNDVAKITMNNNDKNSNNCGIISERASTPKTNRTSIKFEDLFRSINNDNNNNNISKIDNNNNKTMEKLFENTAILMRIMKNNNNKTSKYYQPNYSAKQKQPIAMAIKTNQRLIKQY